MAQPSSLADARAAAVALGRSAPTRTEELPLRAAAGRVAADDVPVRVALPLFDASAMDGWAVRAADVAGATAASPVRLTLGDEARAGHPSDEGVVAGAAVRISTGARLPPGADAVVRAEDAQEAVGVAGVAVLVRVAARSGADVRRAGEDVALGAPAVSAGEALHAGRIALLAGTGVGFVRCRRRPTVTVLVTGDEVASGAGGGVASGAVDETASVTAGGAVSGTGGAVSGTVGAGEVHDVNGVAVPALLAGAGAEVVAVVRVGDDRDATVRAFAAATGDVVVSCGGVSVGAHDHVRAALAALGAEERVGAVALQPGKPTWLGALPGPDGPRPVVALPGNPGAALVCAALLAVPLLHACEGRPAGSPSFARLAAPTHGDARRVRALRAVLAPQADGTTVATILDGQQPHRLGSLARTEVLVLVPPANAPWPAGTPVEVAPFAAPRAIMGG